MAARASNARFALVALALLVLAVAWLLTRTSDAPARPAEPMVAPEPVAQAPAVLAADAVSAPQPSERTTAAESQVTDPAPAPTSKAARPETLVYGSLLDESGAPIRGAWSAGVSLIDHMGRRRHADAKEEGAYALHALPFGTYWITAGAHGYRNAEATLDLRPEQLMVRKDFTLSKAVVLKVKVVTPEGQDLLAGLKSKRGMRSLLPVATHDHPGNRFFDVRGSLNNTFGVGGFWNYGPQVESLPPGYLGVLVLTCDLPVYVSLVHYHVVLETQRIEPGTEEVTFVLSEEALNSNLATVRFRTVDADSGEPIAGVRAMLSGGAGSDMGSSSDASGVMTLVDREPGRYDMRLFAKDHESLRKTIVAEPGQVTDLGDLLLEKEVRVEGRFVDDAGQGVATKFAIGSLDPAGRAIDMDSNFSYASDGTGAFTITGLGRKQYVLRTSNHDALNDQDPNATAWVSGNVLVNARAGPITGLEIRLHPAATLVLRVKGESADGMGFRVEDQQGRIVVASRFYGSGPRPLKLPPGSYRASLLDGQGQVLSEKPVTLASGPVEIELAR